MFKLELPIMFDYGTNSYAIRSLFWTKRAATIYSKPMQKQGHGKYYNNPAECETTEPTESQLELILLSL